MPPLAYPLHGLNSAMLLVLSLLALVRYGDAGRPVWLALSLACSAPGIVFPEFNFLLFPLATFAVIAWVRQDWRARLRLCMPFIAISLFLALAYLAFQIVTPQGPMTLERRRASTSPLGRSRLASCSQRDCCPPP